MNIQDLNSLWAVINKIKGASKYQIQYNSMRVVIFTVPSGKKAFAFLPAHSNDFCIQAGNDILFIGNAGTDDFPHPQTEEYTRYGSHFVPSKWFEFITQLLKEYHLIDETEIPSVFNNNLIFIEWFQEIK